MFEIDKEKRHKSASFYFIRNKQIACHRVADYPDPKEEGFIAHYEALDKLEEEPLMNDQSSLKVPFSGKYKSLLVETYFTEKETKITQVATDWYVFKHIVPKETDEEPMEKPKMVLLVDRKAASSEELALVYGLNSSLATLPADQAFEFKYGSDQIDFSVEFVEQWETRDRPGVKIAVSRVMADAVSRSVKYTEPE